ncbi:unnamed protein product [Miscanthus lutarioriparius]|uniref:Ubiquitin-like protease family profile domain-containing protein n=1 Tax=Miscanthus lutarioriparius TaxID=422564 RepID=A0A811QK51_9POAL|nr:unnamed protein product [Miscanthus lutarioriparius]
MTEEELPDAELRRDREEASHVWKFQAWGDLVAPREVLKLGPRGREKLALDIHVMSLWTMKEADFCSAQQIQIGFLNPEAYEKLKSRSKKHHELGRSRFRVVSAGSIPMQPASNDLCGFYVMHYMRSLINALSGSQTKVSSTLELTDLEISGFQEDLSSFIIDQVVNPKGVHHLL